MTKKELRNNIRTQQIFFKIFHSESSMIQFLVTILVGTQVQSPRDVEEVLIERLCGPHRTEYFP